MMWMGPAAAVAWSPRPVTKMIRKRTTLFLGLLAVELLET